MVSEASCRGRRERRLAGSSSGNPSGSGRPWRGSLVGWVARTVLAGLLCAAGPLAPPVRAIEIILEYVDLGDNPPEDPFGQLLTGIVHHVASVYENIIEDDHTLYLTYRWDADSQAIGQSIPSSIEEEDGRIVSAEIRFIPDPTPGFGRPWYLDPTPSNDSEFNLSQVLARDLTVAQVGARFRGTFVPRFEAGFNGPARNSAPLLAQQGFDLLTVAFQEVGHSVAMHGAHSGTTNETGQDLDFDIDPDFVGGAVMALKARGGDLDPFDHLVGSDAVMGNLGGTGFRSLPSAADILAMAATSDFVSLDIPRREYWATTDNLNQPLNWTGNQLPGAADTAYVRHGAPTAELTANLFPGRLVLSEGSTIRTNNHRLDLTFEATIDGGGAVSEIVVATGGEFEVPELTLGDGGRVNLLGGLLDSDQVTIAAGGRLRGRGTADVSGSLVNDGRISAEGGTLTLASVDAVAFDLDGANGAGELDATNGSLVVGSGLTDSYGGVATIGAGRSIHFTSGWSQASSGQLVLAGDDDPATVRATTSDIFGEIEVSGWGSFDSQVTFHSAANVNVVGSNDRLTLTEPITYRGGSFTGSGRLVHDADATIAADTTIELTTLDLDGAAGTSDLTVAPGVRFEILSNRIEVGDNDGFDGNLNLNGGELAVETLAAWRLDGNLNLTQVGGDQPLVAGPATMVQHTTSTIQSTGIATVSANTRLGGTVSVLAGRLRFSGDATLTSSVTADIEVNARLSLLGPTELQGGSYVGNGRLELDGPTTVTANTTIGIADLDWDGSQGNGSTTVEQGVRFSIASTITEPTANDGHDGTVAVYGGTLSVLAGWRLDGQLITAAGQGQVSRLEGVGPLRVHQGAEATNSGDLVVEAPLQLAGNWRHQAGRAEFTGGFTLESTARLELEDELDVTGPWTVPAGALVVLDGGLVSGGDVTNSGYVGGDGRFVTGQFRNQGLVAPGEDDFGLLEFNGFRQLGGSSVQIELGGLTPGVSHDAIEVNGLAWLGGELELSLVDGFDPVPGNVFSVLNHALRFGQFASVSFPDDTPGLVWSVEYGPNQVEVVVEALLVGDANGDCSVGAADYALWAAQFGMTGAHLAADFDGNGSVGAGDYALWAANFGNTCRPVRLTNVPEPSGLVLFALAGGCVSMARRRGGRRCQGESRPMELGRCS